VEHFKQLGYPDIKLINLPVFIEIGKTKSDFADKHDTVRKKYKSDNGEILFVSGSRLTEVKGYCDLIEAASIVKTRSNQPFKVVIVGKGEQEEELKRLITDLGLSESVIMEPWMAPEDFEALIACADVYIHPARFDAFGGGTLHAMALGIPVIGSDGAGVVTERVKHGWNGFIFPAGQSYKIAEYMLLFINNKDSIEPMGHKARKTAEEWPPERGAQIIYNELK
jgi:glycosyltransferase involved in cell wall biosynthesis